MRRAGQETAPTAATPRRQTQGQSQTQDQAKAAPDECGAAQTPNLSAEEPAFPTIVKFLVFGAGAIGVYVGGSLLRAGHPVAVCARPATAAALRAHGLRLRYGDDQAALAGFPVFETLADALSAWAPELVIFALKAFDMAAALDDWRPVATRLPPILCLQNGVDGEAALAEVVGPARVIAGTVATAVSRGGPGEITVERRRGMGIALDHALSRPILQALETAGLRARGYASAPALKWSKLLTNLVGNAASAILDLPVSALFADPRLFDVERRLLREGLAVMRALRLPVVDLPSTPVRALALAVQLPAAIGRPALQRGVGAGRGGKRPSLHIDLHSGRGQTEVRWLNGAVVRHGAALGVPTPVNQVLTDTLEALSRGELAPDQFRGRPAALLDLINA